MWDLYAALGSELLRLGLHEDAGGGIVEPVGRLKAPGTITRVDWLEGADCLAVHHSDGILVTDRALAQTRAIPEVMGVSPDGKLAFGVYGKGPSFDLVVLPLGQGEQPLRVTDMCVVQPRCFFVPAIDCVVVIDGDPGTNVARNLLVVALQQLRDKVAAGAREVRRNDLDYDVINGGKLMLPLLPGTGFRTIPEYPGFFCHWNTQTGQHPLQGHVAVIEYPYWDARKTARGQICMSSKERLFDRFFIADIQPTRTRGDGLGILLVGSARKGGDFYLSLQALALPEPGASVREVVERGATFDDHPFKSIELRYTGACVQIAALPDAAGALVVSEDPFRNQRLFRIDLGRKSAEPTHIDLDVAPGPILVVSREPRRRAAGQLGSSEEAPEAKQLLSDFKGAATARVSLGGPIEAPAAPAPAPVVVEDGIVDAEIVEEAPPPPAPLPALAPSVAVARVISAGQAPILPGVGLNLPIGILPADVHLSASVVVIGEASQAELVWWLSQTAAMGEVIYQLHVRARAQCMARWSVRAS